MILLNRKGLFGSKTAVVTDVKDITITVNSAKGGIFKGLNTIILVGYLGQAIPVIKITYKSGVTGPAKIEFHDELVELIDGKIGLVESFDLLLDDMIAHLKKQDVLEGVYIPAPGLSDWMPV
jgi:hypothetical protein